MTGNDVKNILKKYIESHLNLGGVKMYKDVHRCAPTYQKP